ncbi:MAG: hypothetical protein U5R30_06575 [Deltaproteobacteria bacterium]|nr:hypothetical protein [Deltaproteobacteria bacterium]
MKIHAQRFNNYGSHAPSAIPQAPTPRALCIIEGIEERLGRRRRPHATRRRPGAALVSKIG